MKYLNDTRRPKIPKFLKKWCKCPTCRLMWFRKKIGKYIIVNDDYLCYEWWYKYKSTIVCKVIECVGKGKINKLDYANFEQWYAVKYIPKEWEIIKYKCVWKRLDRKNHRRLVQLALLN